MMTKPTAAWSQEPDSTLTTETSRCALDHGESGNNAVNFYNPV
jgi:hypothetical protein